MIQTIEELRAYNREKRRLYRERNKDHMTAINRKYEKTRKKRDYSLVWAKRKYGEYAEVQQVLLEYESLIRQKEEQNGQINRH